MRSNALTSIWPKPATMTAPAFLLWTYMARRAMVVQLRTAPDSSIIMTTLLPLLEIPCLDTALSVLQIFHASRSEIETCTNMEIDQEARDQCPSTEYFRNVSTLVICARFARRKLAHTANPSRVSGFWTPSCRRGRTEASDVGDDLRKASGKCR